MFDLDLSSNLIEFDIGQGGTLMLETLIIALLVLWLLGVITGTAGNFIHFLLVVGFVMFVVRLFSGRRAF